mmetsp:Transcript_62394/g.140651  ORF Transcript_62394/g.140651 Transcript_62394/m.140651 type:complete len:205 (-) Transcript_62394:1366-1980(-)
MSATLGGCVAVKPALWSDHCAEPVTCACAKACAWACACPELTAGTANWCTAGATDEVAEERPVEMERWGLLLPPNPTSGETWCMRGCADIAAASLRGATAALGTAVLLGWPVRATSLPDLCSPRKPATSNGNSGSGSPRMPLSSLVACCVQCLCSILRLSAAMFLMNSSMGSKSKVSSPASMRDATTSPPAVRSTAARTVGPKL